MSSSMRGRRSLMGFSLIGAPVLRLEVANPSILKTEHPPRHLIQANRVPSIPFPGSLPWGHFLWPALPELQRSGCTPGAFNPPDAGTHALHLGEARLP